MSTGVSSVERLAFLDGLGPESHSDTWFFNNSSIGSYLDGVKLEGHPEGPLSIIEAQLASVDYRVGIDLAGGADGVALRGLMQRGLLDHGLVTNLTDQRCFDPSGERSIEHFAGDLLQPETWQSIRDWQERTHPDGVSLVMHRPIGALQDLPPRFYRGAAHSALDMLGPGGVLVTQIPAILLKSNRGRNTPLERIGRSIAEREDVAEVIPPKGIRGLRRNWSPAKKNAVVIKK